ncbi:hypothetical protein QAD02_019480 [Eretmocerus hayati]|uniref:Uncharacterized protein n=1 Tax=Eretmocerus hayati TaxID=131215 RepID=A0ACC2PKT2_9HYME|nr:hypothetical protein QAD02_019480 [Eretmocerus hayati]
MEPESESVQKKAKVKPNLDIQVAECVRQFELPQQFPSTVVKLYLPKHATDSILPALKSKKSQNSISSLPLPGGLKFIPNKEVPLTENLQKLKLKLPDGRDLGEVKIVRSSHVEQNSSAKFIPMPKIGQNFNNLDLLQGNTTATVNNAKPKIKTVTRVVSSINATKRSNATESPQTQSHLINGNHHPPPETDTQNEIALPSSSQFSNRVRSNPKTKEVVVHNTNADMIKKIRVEDLNGDFKTITLKNLAGSPKIVMLKKDNLTGQHSLDKNSSPKPPKKNQAINFGIHRAVEDPSFKNPENSLIMRKRENCALGQSNDSHPKRVRLEAESVNHRNELSGKRDVLQSEPTSHISQESILSSNMNSQSGKDSKELSVVSSYKNNDQDLVWDDGGVTDLSSGKSHHNSYSCYLNTSRESPESKGAQKSPQFIDIDDFNQTTNDNFLDSQDTSFDILEKAVLSVNDASLRAKALQALRECGMRAKRTIPLKRPIASKMIIDSTTQTEVFSLLKSEEFILVNEKSPSLVKIKEGRKTLGQPINTTSRSIHTAISESDFQTEFKNELDGVVTKLFPDSTGPSEIKDALLQNQKTRAKAILKQIKEDFESASKYDNDGWLGIHRAVMNNSVMEVQRHIIIMKAAKQSIDVCTQDGQTSLELAVEYEVNPQIVQVLLDAGAQPVSSKYMHDSAVHLAAKTSAKILILLLKYVNTDNRLLLNKKDSEGLAPIHHCAQYGNLEGVKELLKHGIDVNLKDDKSGRTALFYAVERRNPSVPADKYYEIAHALLNKGALSNIPIFSKHTVLSMIDEVKNLPLKIALNKAIR